MMKKLYFVAMLKTGKPRGLVVTLEETLSKPLPSVVGLNPCVSQNLMENWTIRALDNCSHTNKKHLQQFKTICAISFFVGFSHSANHGFTPSETWFWWFGFRLKPIFATAL